MGENGQSFVLGSKARTGSDRRFRANHSGSLSTGSPVGSLERKSQQHFLPKLIIKGTYCTHFCYCPTLNEHSKVSVTLINEHFREYAPLICAHFFFYFAIALFC